MSEKGAPPLAEWPSRREPLPGSMCVALQQLACSQCERSEVSAHARALYVVSIAYKRCPFPPPVLFDYVIPIRSEGYAVPFRMIKGLIPYGNRA